MEISGVTMSPETAPNKDLAQPSKVVDVQFDADGDILLLLLPLEGGEVNGEDYTHNSLFGLLPGVF